MLGLIREYRGLQPLLQNSFDVIIYVESGAYFQYLEYIVRKIQPLQLRIAYISSDSKDPHLQDLQSSMQTFYARSTLAFLFPKLKSRVMIMTMPDLGNFILKRSRFVKEYVYVFHAMVSTHQQYRKHAFDHYDTVFCTSPQQVQEIRKFEQLHQLPAKKLVEFGYPLINEMMSRRPVDADADAKVLIAPSWSTEGIFESCLPELVSALANSKYKVLLRPHPEFIKRFAKRWKTITNVITSSSNISIDRSANVTDTLLQVDHLITDRSGIAFEFALATQRPVLFIDTPPKIVNPDYQELGIEPIEDRFRDAIGKRISVAEVANIISELDSLERLNFSEQIELVRSEVLFAPGSGSGFTGFKDWQDQD